MNKLHRNRCINVVVSMMMAFLMFAAMGTTQVHAAQYTTGTIDPAELKAGDVVYRGVQLTVEYDMDYDGHGLRYRRHETL